MHSGGGGGGQTVARSVVSDHDVLLETACEELELARRPVRLTVRAADGRQAGLSVDLAADRTHALRHVVVHLADCAVSASLL